MSTLTILMIAYGGDIHALRPLNWLLERGCRVVFSDSLNPFPGGREGYAFTPLPLAPGGRVLPQLLGENVGGRLFQLSEPISVSRLKRLWGRAQPSVVHVHWVDDRAYYCAKAGLRPLVLTAWGSDINIHFLPDANPALRRRVGEALAGADLILIDAADMQKKCADLAGREVPTELITLGVNTDLFHPGNGQTAIEWRRKLGVPPGAVVFLSGRGWSPLYRHESILEAFARALPRMRSEAVLVFKILERERMDRALYEKKMRGLAQELGVSRMVRWMEEVPLDLLPELYSFADVILNYPSMDGFPVTFLEAGACECPVISCRLPAYAGTFAEEYFRMVSADDLSELSEAMVQFVNGDRMESQRRLSELRGKVCRDHDERIVAERLLGIYRRLSSTI